MYVSWTTHTANLTASVAKEVTCERCRTEYVYAMVCTASGSGLSLYGIGEQGAAGRAVDEAAEKLRMYAHNDFELVPCPACGHYQAPMVGFMKGAYRKWLYLPAGVLILLALAWFVYQIVGSADSILRGFPGVLGAFLLLVAGGALIGLRSWWSINYDPNSGDPGPRIELGRAMAVLKKDLPSDETAAGKKNNNRRRARL